MFRLIQVSAYNTRLEADLVACRLESGGIATIVSADNLAGAFPLMQLTTGGHRILVSAEHLKAARREVTAVGQHALDSGIHLRTPPDAETRATRMAYVCAVFVGWGLGYGWYPVVFGWF